MANLCYTYVRKVFFQCSLVYIWLAWRRLANFTSLLQSSGALRGVEGVKAHTLVEDLGEFLDTMQRRQLRRVNGVNLEQPILKAGSTATSRQTPSSTAGSARPQSRSLWTAACADDLFPELNSDCDW
eukprot:435118-Pyramimonas_sp.AAC.1